MDRWFSMTLQYCEAFHEHKLEQYGAAVAALHAAADVESAARLLDAAGTIDAAPAVAPAEWADGAERAVFDAFAGLPAGHTLATAEEDTEVATLYGELTTSGVRQLCAIATEEVATQGVGDGVAFVDLGSGTGKVCLDAALVLGPRRLPCGVLGIEYCQERHRVATLADAKLRTLLRAAKSGGHATDPAAAAATTSDKFTAPPPYPSQCAETDFVAGDFLECAHPVLAAAPSVVAFCCGVGFDTAFTGRILDRLRLLGPRLCAAVLLFKSPPLDHPLLTGAPVFEATGRVYVQRRVHLDCTWMDNAPAYLVTTAAAADATE